MNKYISVHSNGIIQIRLQTFIFFTFPNFLNLLQGFHILMLKKEGIPLYNKAMEKLTVHI